jgi:hypothetical protein
LSHRVSWEHHRGPVPDGLMVLHYCDNPPCVNPDHLFLGTHDENMKDCTEKRRTLHGERHNMAKLTWTDIRAIREHGLPDKRASRRLGDKYGVRPSHIRKIINCEIWNPSDDPEWARRRIVGAAAEAGASPRPRPSLKVNGEVEA